MVYSITFSMKSYATCYVSIIRKTVEKIVTSRVVLFWTEHQLLNPRQFGYLEGRSTLLQAVKTTGASQEIRQKGLMQYFWTFQKRLSVPHERLVLKLNRYAIDGQLRLWFRNFLTNRKQRVLIRGWYSDWSPGICGVPQGSILGPVMFLIYVNDISDMITSTAKLFDDDNESYQQIKNVEDPIALQIDLTTLHLWADRLILPNVKS